MIDCNNLWPARPSNTKKPYFTRNLKSNLPLFLQFRAWWHHGPNSALPLRIRYLHSSHPECSQILSTPYVTVSLKVTVLICIVLIIKVLFFKNMIAIFLLRNFEFTESLSRHFCYPVHGTASSLAILCKLRVPTPLSLVFLGDPIPFQSFMFVKWGLVP